MRQAWMPTALVAAACLLPAAGPARADDAPADNGHELRLTWGLEAKTNYRDSEHTRFVSPFPFPADFIPAGQNQVFEETVDQGSHFEVSTLTIYADAVWGENLVAHAKIDFIDLYDRNPTSSDHNVDVDEIWIRFGHDPNAIPDRFGMYAKVGKFAHFERQNDRHLESYGLVSTAFNRFEDQGLEVGADFGRHLYARVSLTQGNPVFFRDPNALAGDNGTPELDPAVHPNPTPALKSGFPILYDAEVEDFDVSGNTETGYGLGLRFGDPDAGRAVNLLAWSYRRDLADTVKLNGTFYGGDLDLLNGPFNELGLQAGLPIRGNKKKEDGANLWLYAGGFSLFGQYVAQQIAGLDRNGWEVEAAWRFDLPIAAAFGGRQLFPSIQPAVRYSHLKPEFAGGGPFPGPSVRWEWTKIDYGIRLAVVQGVDLTVEFADNQMTLANGSEISNDELLATLRWRI